MALLMAPGGRELLKLLEEPKPRCDEKVRRGGDLGRCEPLLVHNRDGYYEVGIDGPKGLAREP